MQYNGLLNQRTICRRDCHEREKVICIHACGLRPLAAAGGADATREKYLRSILAFAAWLGGAAVTKDAVTEWKAHLAGQHQAPSTVNTALAALNGLLRFLGWEDCRAKFLKIQRRIFRAPERELTRAEYARLLAAAKNSGDARLALLMESICATGIRVSEVKFLTVEAAQCGRAEIALKGKIRTILLPAKLCRKLLKYAKKQKIARGEIFLTTGGKGMDRRQIWSAMKRLCRKAGVAPSKVFPHNLRHLFATAYYRVYRDIVKLADMLGHSSIETTRIYLVESGAEHQRQLDRLGLIT